MNAATSPLQPPVEPRVDVLVAHMELSFSGKPNYLPL